MSRSRRLADIPSAGSGLGSSSSVTVGLLHALFAYQGRQVSAEELADRACTIEIDRCGKPIGKQDQYVAAYGGICDLRFGPGDAVRAEQIHLRPEEHRRFQSQLMLFYTGITGRRTRSSGSRRPTSRCGSRSSSGCATSPAEASPGCGRGTPTTSVSRSARAGRPSAAGGGRLEQHPGRGRRLRDARRRHRREDHRRGRRRLRPRPVPGGAPGVRADRPGTDEDLPISIDPYGSG